MKVGDRLRDRYSIVRSIKSGGMGALYLARDGNLGESLCAVKQMHNLGSELDDYMKGRFESEMLALVRLQHPGIPRVRDYFQHEGSLFLVMDYIEGQSLEEEMEQKRQGGQTFGALAAVSDMLAVLDVLAYMHAQDPAVLHRDIKPANLIRESGSGNIKVVDFGLARSVEGGGSQTTVGTLGYSAVEQLTGQPEQRSDVYSVGVTLHEMVSGLRPSLAGVVELTGNSMPDFDAGLARVIAKAADLEASQRYDSVLDMRQALSDWVAARNSTGTVVVRGLVMPPVTRSRPRRRAWLLAGALFTLGGWALFSKVGVRLPPIPAQTQPAADPGLAGDIFAYRAENQAGSVSLGEDIGLFQVRGLGTTTAVERSKVLAGRLNDLYHHRCDKCGTFLLEPAGIRIGKYDKDAIHETVMFYAHMHGDDYITPPLLLATVDKPLADRLNATPRTVAGFWRNLLRDVVSLSRGESTHQSPLGPSLRNLLSEARQQQKKGEASIGNLQAILKKLPGQQSRDLQSALLKIPPELVVDVDRFPTTGAFSPLTI
ncbi:serine/threonine protein kinase [bacterium]|nr:serine/threonine protein kinase [bacterium]